MSVLIYKVQFHSEWHCGSGLSSGADLDAMAIRDRNGLPYIPGKTLKGLLRDAACSLCELRGAEPGGDPFVKEVFGWQTDRSGNQSEFGRCHFSNAELSGESQEALLAGNKLKLPLLFRKRSATAIDKDGQAKEYSLRRIETVVPLALFAKVSNIPDCHVGEMERCLKWIKRLGVNRNRGLGRCGLSTIKRETVK